MQSSYINGSTELSALKLKTKKESVIGSYESHRKKVYRDSSNAIQFDDATSTDYNIIYFSPTDTFIHDYYCTTSDACDLLKEYFRSKDPAKEVGITEETYYEYSNYEINVENPKSGYSSEYPTNFLNTYIKGSLPSEFEYSYNIGYNGMVFGEPNSKIKKVDLSNAIYIEGRGNSPYAFVYVSEIVFPPNIEFGCIDSEKITFTKDTKLISEKL